MHLFRISEDHLNNATSQMEDYFKDIGMLEQFLQYKENFSEIKSLIDYISKAPTE